ncbi:MAG: flavodoxin family protein [Bacteroidetes bacterium]|nr:flavodoxin family protein [Bacteroidota bacterium]
MKAVAFNGSPRKRGNTYDMIMKVFEKLEKDSISCEVVQVGNENIHGCRACGACSKNKNNQCVFQDDLVNDALWKMMDADVVILGSPTYFAALTPEIKALIDRCGYVARANGGLLKRKIGASVVPVRRAGALNVFQALNNFFFINEMIVPGSSYWNLSVAQKPGDFTEDAEGVETMETLGENISWLLQKIKSRQKI